MAKQIITKLIDDLDGGEADETVAFSLDGVDYTIDLSAENAGRLRAMLAPYTAKGERHRPQRQAGSTGSLPALNRKGQTQAAERAERAAIRAWAQKYPKAVGFRLGDKGRIPAKVTAEYHRHGGKAPAGYDLPESVREIKRPAQTAMSAAFLAAAENASPGEESVPSRPSRRRSSEAVKVAAEKPAETASEPPTAPKRAPRKVAPKASAEPALAEAAGVVPAKAPAPRKRTTATTKK